MSESISSSVVGDYQLTLSHRNSRFSIVQSHKTHPQSKKIYFRNFSLAADIFQRALENLSTLLYTERLRKLPFQVTLVANPAPFGLATRRKRRLSNGSNSNQNSPTQKTIMWDGSEKIEGQKQKVRKRHKAFKKTDSPKRTTSLEQASKVISKPSSPLKTIEPDLQQFLGNEDLRTLLLITHSNANVPSLCRDLQIQLKSQYKSLYVHYIKVTDEEIEKDDTKIVFNHVKKEHGLLDDEATHGLRDCSSFIFIVEGAEKYANFFVRNSLSDWKAHTIFVCNSSRVSSDSFQRANKFAPHHTVSRHGALLNQFNELHLLDEAAVLSSWKDYPKYQEQIEKQGLKPLIAYPLFLEIIKDVLPDAKNSQNLLDQVIDQWFTRQEVDPAEGKQICSELAKAINSNEVDEFSVLADKSLLATCPIKRTGKDGFSFLESSLQNHFC